MSGVPENRTSPTQSSSELTIQALEVDKKLLIVCTGPSGEAFAFIGVAETRELFVGALKLHRLVDKASKNETDKATRRRLVRMMRAYGSKLFGAVFNGSTLDLLNLAIGQAIQLNADVRLRLMIATSYLNIIPWELMCQQDNFLSHEYDVFRHPFVLRPTGRIGRPASKTRLLFIGANPLNNIHVESHAQAALEVLSGSEVNLQVRKLCTPVATHTAIADAIYDGADILHLLAHGKFDKATGGYFLIDGEDGRRVDRLSVEMLESLTRAEPVQLAILNACRSDQATAYSLRSIKRLQSTAHKSFAHALIKAGVPCVIGMSHPISKVGAEILTRRLYRGLTSNFLAGPQSISKAMRQSRLELFAHSDDLLPSDWFTPVLYSRDFQYGAASAL